MQTLRYRPANGQDAAPLIAALHSAGYDASADAVQGQQQVVITAGNGQDLDREQVRSVLAAHNETSVFDGGDVQRPIRFVGEE